MFFQFTSADLQPVEPGDINPEVFTVGYVTLEELAAVSQTLGFEQSTVDACKNANRFFRTGVEVHRAFTFTELRILNAHEEAGDFIALFIKNNLFVVVDIEDRDSSTKNKFFASVRKYPAGRVCPEKVLFAFLDSLLAGDNLVLETLENDLSEKEEALFSTEVEKTFNMELLHTKKELTKRHAYYSQLLDMTEAVYENENDIFDEDSLIYVDNISKKIARLKEDTASLRATVEHLQDAYSSYLDTRMNQTMKIFTVLTSIFFPLTIIVGWYGMNFRYMPELTWKYGYVFVILLSIVTVLVLWLIGRKKKWF